MSRRQTLANVSPTQLQRGNSISQQGGSNAPARVAKDAQPKGRKSMGAALLGVDRPSGIGLDRRSSAYGNKPSGPKQDPRPLSDKNYLNNCVRVVITYLSTHNYPAQVAPKTLASPTGKDFALVVSFLFQQFDPTFRITGKVEDEVPAFFKRLNYPFQISKSALFAVGSPHSWPAVLAALTWLVELLNYSEKVEQSSGATFERENKVEQDFLEYLASGYSSFMSGNDLRCQQLDEELAAKFKVREQEIEERCEKLRKANSEVVSELEALRRAPDPVEAAQARLAEQRTDTEKFEQLIQNLQGLKATLQRKLAEKQADLKARQDQTAAALAEIEGLRARVAGQTINKADLNRMKLERNKQREVLESEQAKCEDMERKVHEQEVQIVRDLTALDSVAERYNALAHRLKLVPAATAKRAEGVNYELRINRDASSAAEFANVDLKGVVKPALERLCESYRTKASQLAQDLISLRENATSRAELNHEKAEENAHLGLEISRYEGQLAAAKEGYEEKVRQLQNKAESIKGQVEAMRAAASNRSESVEERVAAAQQEYEAAQRDAEAELTRLDTDLKTALSLLYNHKRLVLAALTGAAQAVAGVRQEVAAMQSQGTAALQQLRASVAASASGPSGP